MACGLKKQNNNEGGVHLTERTCSPYNPIIKQIVDDCLGLPIYPVSSIDAVIDEDGNTLRKILDDLLLGVKSGSFSIQEILDSLTIINNTINDLNETYVTNEHLLTIIENLTADINGLTSWLMLISKYDLESSTEEAEKANPHILQYLSQLKGLVEIILRTLGIDPNNPGTPGDGGLNGKINELEQDIRALDALVQEIGKCGEETLRVGGDGLVYIVHYVKNLLGRMTQVEGALGMNPGDEDNPSILARLGALEGKLAGIEDTVVNYVTNYVTNITDALDTRIDALEEEAKGHAHLDTKVLDLMPADFGTDNQTVIEKRKSLYKTLKISEYPPTSAKFLTYAITSDTGLYYLGFLPPVELNNRPDFYPFGHTDSDKGYPLFYVTSRKADGTPAGYAELTAAGQPNKQLYAGDGTISGSDYVLLIKMIYGFAPEYASTPDPSISENLKYEDLYIDFNGNKVPVGDVNLDGEVTVPDVNTLINTYNTNASSHSMTVSDLPATYSKNLAAGYLLYQNPTANNTYVLYPCIEGKVYVDTLTGNAYSYSDNKMYPVAKDEFVGSDGILIKKSVLFTDVTDDENLEGPYNLYKISIADDTLPNTITCKYINDLDAIDNDTEDFEYFLYEGLYLVIPSLGVPDAKITIDGSTVEVEHNIGSVTSLIDSLLGGSYSTLLKTTVENKKAALLDWVEDKIAETPGTDKDALDKLNYIKDHILGLSPTHTIHPILTIEVVYAEKNNGSYTLKKFVVTDPYYALNAFCAFWDFNVDNLTNIGDVTSLIDSLLSSELGGKGKYSLEPNGPYPYINPVALGASIWIKTDELPQQVVPLGTTDSGHQMLVEGRLFRAVHSDLAVTNYDWYYFDDTYAVRPLNPKFDLDYNSTTGYLSLYQNGVEIDGIQTNIFPKNIGRTSSPGGTYEIRNLGKNSTPYLFGTWKGGQLPCFLNPDKSVIKDAKVSVTMDDISRIFSVDLILDKSAWFDKGSGNLVLIHPSDLTLSLDCPDIAFTELKDYSMFTYVGAAPYTSDFTEKIRDVLKKHIKNADFSKSAAEITAAFNTDNEYTLTYWGLGPEGYLYKVLDYIKVTMSEEALNEILPDNSEEITNEILSQILLEAVTLNANITIIDSEKLDPNTIYYFPKFGLQIRFEIEQVVEEESTEYIYHPVIVQVERKEYDKNHVFSNFTEGEIGNGKVIGDTTPFMIATLVYPNEHLEVGPVDSIYFDCSRLENIPGFKYIDVSGSFIANTNNMSLTLGSSSIGVNNSNPIIRAHRFYEYHIFNGVFSFEDISISRYAGSDSPDSPHGPIGK